MAPADYTIATNAGVVIAQVAHKNVTDKVDPRVAAVRADDQVGRGSCSSIDECMTDDELVAYLDERGATTPAEAVAEARKTWAVQQAVWNEREGW